MSEGIISFSYLSKFEKRQTQMSLTNFIQLAQRLNMTVDGILLFNNTKIIHYMEFSQKIFLAYVENNLAALKAYLKMEEKLYEETQLNYHQHNRIMITVIVKDLDKDFEIPENDVDLLVDYIVKCSFWTTYEVSLFGNILPLFSKELLTILLTEIKQKISGYQAVNQNCQELIGIIQNACILFLRKKQVKEARYWSNYLEKVIERIYYFEKTRKIYIGGIIKIASGEYKAGTKKATKAIEVMNLMDEPYGKNHALELAKFQALYTKKAN